MKKIEGEDIAAIIFILCISVIYMAILFVFWIKISPWFAISLAIISIFLIRNAK